MLEPMTRALMVAALLTHGIRFEIPTVGVIQKESKVRPNPYVAYDEKGNAVCDATKKKKLYPTAMAALEDLCRWSADLQCFVAESPTEEQKGR